MITCQKNGLYSLLMPIGFIKFVKFIKFTHKILKCATIWCYFQVVCSLHRAKIAVFLVYLVTLIVCIPNFVTITVQGEGVVPDNDTTTYIWVVSFKLDTSTDKFVYDFNFWIQAILVKLVPCIGLTILSILLIRTMKKAEKRRRNLMMKSLKPGGEEENTSRDRKTNRTTRMLLVIVGLFLLTEAPQVCYVFLSPSYFQASLYCNDELDKKNPFKKCM